MRLRWRKYPSKITTHEKYPDVVEKIDQCLDNLMDLMFCHNMTPCWIRQIAMRIEALIASNQLYFYYHVVPPIIPNDIIHRETITKNFYMLRLIRESMLNNQLVVRGTSNIIQKYKQKFNLL